MSHDFTKALFQECLRRGLLAMVYNPVIRLNPPLNISEETALEGLSLFDEALTAVAREWKLDVMSGVVCRGPQARGARVRERCGHSKGGPSRR